MEVDADRDRQQNGFHVEDEGLFMSWVKWAKKFDDFEYEKIHFLETCAHIICKPCFIKVVRKEYIQHQKADWPECGQQINEYEIKAILGTEVFESLQKDALMAIVNEDQSMVKCQCGNVMEVSEGKVDYNVKDDQGQKLSRKAAEHMSKYRIRCSACQNNFCTSCQTQPYHIGKTCEEHKKFSESIKCRFCGDAIAGGKAGGAFKDVCKKKECKGMIKMSCDKIHECGHPCKGFAREIECLPWLHPDWVAEHPDITLGEDDTAFCSIWFISGIGDQPSIQLGCKHIFHVDCIAEKVRQKWSGPRITFLFKTCPSCKAEIEAHHHPEISELLEEASKLEEEIKSKALERAKHEGLDKDPRLKKVGDPYYNDLEKYAMARLSYYTCYECKNPYFGGLKDWGNLLEAEANFKEEELVWGKCSSKHLDGKVTCPKHKEEYIEFKCRYCCSLSQWFCFGTTHFCDPCHRVAGNNKITKCPGPGSCGLTVPHPDNGEEFALGCGLCRHTAFSEF